MGRDKDYNGIILGERGCLQNWHTVLSGDVNIFPE